MKIIITERQYKRILREDKEFKNKLFNLLNSGQDENIEMVKYLSEGQGYNLIDLLFGYFKGYGPPYFKIFNILELTEEEQGFILKKILGNDISIDGRNIYDDNGNNIYYEDPDGEWEKREYDDKGNRAYIEDSDGFWEKSEYDKYGNQITFEYSDDRWVKYEYDDNGSWVYYEDSYGNIKDNR